MRLPEWWAGLGNAPPAPQHPLDGPSVACMGTDDANLQRHLERIAELTPEGAGNLPSSPAIAALLARAVPPPSTFGR